MRQQAESCMCMSYTAQEMTKHQTYQMLHLDGNSWMHTSRNTQHANSLHVTCKHMIHNYCLQTLQNTSTLHHSKRAYFLLTSFLEVCTSNTSLVEVLCVHSVECVEQGMSGGVISPIAQVKPPNECYQPPLGCLATHIGMWGRLGLGGRAVVTGASPPQPL